MNDTPADVRERFHGMLMGLSPEDRLIRGCRMFDTAKALVVAAIEAEHGSQVSPKTMRRELLLRFYANDVSERLREMVLND